MKKAITIILAASLAVLSMGCTSKNNMAKEINRKIESKKNIVENANAEFSEDWFEDFDENRHSSNNYNIKEFFEEEFSADHIYSKKEHKVLSYEKYMEGLPNKTPLKGNQKNIKNLSIDAEVCHVVFKFTKEDTIRAEYAENTEMMDYILIPRLKENEDTLSVSVKEKKGQKELDKNFFKKKNNIPTPVLTIYIPEKMNHFEKIEFNLNVGDTEITNLKTDKLVFDANVADFNIHDNQIKKLILSGNVSDGILDFDTLDVLDMNLNVSDVGIRFGNLKEYGHIYSSVGDIGVEFKNKPNNLNIQLTGDISDSYLPEEWYQSKSSSFVYGTGETKLDIKVSVGDLVIK